MNINTLPFGSVFDIHIVEAWIESELVIVIRRRRSTRSPVRVVQRNKNVFTYFYKQTKERNEVKR